MQVMQQYLIESNTHVFQIYTYCTKCENKSGYKYRLLLLLSRQDQTKLMSFRKVVVESGYTFIFAVLSFIYIF